MGFARLGCWLAALAVAMGAFGAHLLQMRLTPDRLAVFETAVRYQMYHALALVVVGVAQRPFLDRNLSTAAGWTFAAGIVLFSGSLYALVLTGARWWGAVTPLGGVAFLAGWVLLSVAVRTRANVGRNHP
jgi:uncharacterized membrane protein YgdD (TMEM256/DUF423 family)